MKTFTLRNLILVLSVLFSSSFANATNPQYKINIENLVTVAPNSIEFEIFLQHTNPDDGGFQYAVGQYFFDFNPGISNGGKLKYTLIDSELPEQFRPGNPTVSGSQLRLATNFVSGTENSPVISSKFPGTLIAKMRLETSAESFSKEALNLSLRVGPENPITKIGSLSGNQIADITNSAEVQTDINGVTEVNNEIPKEFALQQNYPNPFNPVTRINYDLPVDGPVTLKIFDMTGREVAALVNETQKAGTYSVQFNGSNLASGIYFFRINVGNSSANTMNSFVQTRKMVLIK